MKLLYENKSENLHLLQYLYLYCHLNPSAILVACARRNIANFLYDGTANFLGSLCGLHPYKTIKKEIVDFRYEKVTRSRNALDRP